MIGDFDDVLLDEPLDELDPEDADEDEDDEDPQATSPTVKSVARPAVPRILPRRNREYPVLLTVSSY
jgi:hypothetical protein